jgi:DNA-binding response OmpR family regulator
MKTRILVTDDDEWVAEYVALVLHKAGFEVTKAFTGREALSAFPKTRPDLVVLDIILPDLSGFEVCRRIRRSSRVPIVFLTCKEEDISKIKGLNLGADDYVTKPFNPDELVARVRAVIKRSGTGSSSDVVYRGDLVIDGKKRQVWNKRKLVELSPREFDLLHFLCRNPGRIATRDELRREVWEGEFISERSIDVCVKRLRGKIGDNAESAKHIKTVRCVGYTAIPLGENI